MFIKRFIVTLVVMCIVLSSVALPVCALDDTEITSPSVILMEPVSHKILFEKNAHEKRACASITKVMTLLLIMEALDEGAISYTDVVTTSEHAKSMGGSDIWLEVGEQMTVDEMIKATAVASANDAAVALAEHLCGSESEFVDRMNKKAKQLGMKDTVFKNCNGLDEEGHLSSAYDVALMSAELMKHEKIFEYTNIWIDYLRDGETQIVNTNKLLKTYTGITGLKTGTTGQAGSCISATAERNDMSLVAVVLGSSTGTERFKDAATLLDYGFANYEVVKLDPKKLKLSDIKVTDGMKKEVAIECDDNLSVIVKKGSKEKVEQEVKLKETVKAPIKKGDKVGVINFTLDSKTIAQFDVVTKESVEKISFSAVFSQLVGAVFAL